MLSPQSSVLGGLALLAFAQVYAQQAPYTSATISGLGARNIGSATMSGRISAIAGAKDPSGRTIYYVGAASGGVWKSDDGGTHYKPVFDDQPVQSIDLVPSLGAMMGFSPELSQGKPIQELL